MSFMVMVSDKEGNYCKVSSSVCQTRRYRNRPTVNKTKQLPTVILDPVFCLYRGFDEKRQKETERETGGREREERKKERDGTERERQRERDGTGRERE